MIIRTSGVIPDLKRAHFRCVHCFYSIDVLVERGRVEEPSSCVSCSSKLCMEMIHNRSIFGDKQLIKLQEIPENIPEGETPQTVNVFAHGDLVDSVKPGDRVEVKNFFLFLYI